MVLFLFRTKINQFKTYTAMLKIKKVTSDRSLIVYRGTSCLGIIDAAGSFAPLEMGDTDISELKQLILIVENFELFYNNAQED